MSSFVPLLALFPGVFIFLVGSLTLLQLLFGHLFYWILLHVGYYWLAATATLMLSYSLHYGKMVNFVQLIFFSQNVYHIVSDLI